MTVKYGTTPHRGWLRLIDPVLAAPSRADEPLHSIANRSTPCRLAITALSGPAQSPPYRLATPIPLHPILPAPTIQPIPNRPPPTDPPVPVRADVPHLLNPHHSQTDSPSHPRAGLPTPTCRAWPCPSAPTFHIHPLHPVPTYQTPPPRSPSIRAAPTARNAKRPRRQLPGDAAFYSLGCGEACPQLASPHLFY